MSIKVHAGDWSKSPSFARGAFFFPKGAFGVERIPADQLDALEEASEESVKRLGGTLGWGAAGALLLGPLGMLAGLLVGGNATRVTFVARFKDGRKMLATTDRKTYTQLRGAVLA